MADSKQSPPESAPELTPEQCRKFALEAIARYQELAIGLLEARAFLYPGQDRKPDRKLAFLHGVASVVQFLQRTSFFLEQQAEEPLTQLLFELQTVAMNIPSHDFVSKPGARRKGVRYRDFQMNCALLLESYIAAGLKVEEASARVVRLMKTNIAPRTIEDWRTDFSNVKNEDEFGRRFRELKEEFTRTKPTLDDVDHWVRRLQLRFADLPTSAQKNISRDKLRKTNR